MIQAKDLSPDSRRMTLTWTKDKNVSSGIVGPLISTHNKRYRVVSMSLQVLEPVVASSFSFGIGELTDLPNTITPVLEATDAHTAPLAIGVYDYLPGGRALTTGTLPLVLAADKTYCLYGNYSASGTGAYAFSADIEPVDDNPQ